MPDPIGLADDFNELLKSLPRRATRPIAAELVSQYFFAISPRTLERWPLTWRLLNGKVHCEVAELFALAAAMVDAAPVIKAGRRAGVPAPGKHQA